MDIFTLLYHTNTRIISLEHDLVDDVAQYRLLLSNGLSLIVAGDKILTAIESNGHRLNSQGDLEAYLKECSQEFTT